MGMTTTLANAWLDAYFAVPRFLSLHTAPLLVTGALDHEVPAAGTGYLRQSLAGKIGAASGGVAVNTSTVTFPTILSLYGEPVSDFATSDAASGGAMGLYGSFNESLLKSVGQSYQYPPGTLRFQLR
jgi:hypothetical protein